MRHQVTQRKLNGFARRRRGLPSWIAIMVIHHVYGHLRSQNGKGDAGSHGHWWWDVAVSCQKWAEEKLQYIEGL